MMGGIRGNYCRICDMHIADCECGAPIPAPAVQVEQSEREQFEEAMNADRFFPAELSFAMTKSPSGRDEYANANLESCWVGWQARAALAGHAPVSGTAKLQLAKCWSCKRSYTAAQRAEADGDCPFCGVEIEVDDNDFAEMAKDAGVAAYGAVAEQAATVLETLCSRIEAERKRMRHTPGTGQHDSYLFRDDVMAHVEEARKAMAAAGTPAILPQGDA